MMDAFLARYWTSLDPRVRTALDRALDGGEVTVDDGLALAETTGRELSALTLVADELRARQAGDVVTYVVNRNINFTNVCIKHCTFCAFSRDHREEEGYFLPLEEVIRRAREARELGATEVCMGKLDQVPVAVVRGYRYESGAGSARELLRDPNIDLFR